MSLFLKKISQFFKEDKNLIYVVLFILLVFCLRIYNIDGFTIFLGDQGRDAIIIRRIVTLEHLTAIGATTSIGQIFLGPFYYYFIAPWLLLFNFNPVGLAVGVAVTSCVLLFIIYILVSRLYSRHLAWFVLIASGLASILHNFARFSWNPNLLPYVSFLAVLVLQQLLKSQKMIYALILGSLLSIAIQLHYIALILIVPVGAVFLYRIIFEKKDRRDIIRIIGGVLVSFVVVSSPLLIFDLRHNFLNTHNFIKLFTNTEAVGGGRMIELVNVFSSMNMYLFHIETTSAVAKFSFLLFLVILVSLNFKFRNFRLISFFYFTILAGLSFYNGPKYAHYLGINFIFYFACIGMIFMTLPKKLMKYAMVIFLIFFALISINKYDFLNNEPNYQIKNFKYVADSIIPNITSKKFQLTSLPERHSDYNYRYFLEAQGYRALEKDSPEQATELFVICEKACPVIIGNPMWDIALFAPRKIDKQWKVDNVRIYKLIR